MFTFALLTITIIALYLAGRYIPPVGEVFMFLSNLIGKLVEGIEELLENFKVKPAPLETKYPGLRTIVLIVACILASAALSADIGGSIDALQAFGIAIPTLPAVVNAAIGVLFITTSCLWGALMLEKRVPEEARILIVDPSDQEKFDRFTRNIFIVSVVTSVFFFALRPIYQAAPDANITHLLQWVVYVLLGVLVPLTGMISLYIIAAGLHALLSLALTLIRFAASTFSHCLAFIHDHYEAIAKERAEEEKRLREQKRLQTTTVTEEEPQVPLLPPPPFAGRTRAEFPIIDNGKEHFAERANWALDQFAKVPRILQEIVEALPKIEWDDSLHGDNWWKCISDGRFGYDLSDDDTTLFVVGHEAGHIIMQIRENDASEDAANRYAHGVMVELGRALHV